MEREILWKEKNPFIETEEKKKQKSSNLMLDKKQTKKKIAVM